MALVVTTANASVDQEPASFHLASIWPQQFGLPSNFGFPWQKGPFAEQGASTGTPHPAVVRIVVPEGAAISYGSGTLVDVRGDYGLVITNWHVVRDAQGVIEVRFPDGFHSRARALKMDADWDLAALVIWRPKVSPVKISKEAPQPGDVLTICGYGAGNYRQVSGRCTQYYSPRIDFPQQMVELNVEARQGDSGGPIFNQRGELAGVLFGAGRGTTMGSFGGRVESFLSSLASDIGQPTDEQFAHCLECERTPSQPAPQAPETSGDFYTVSHQGTVSANPRGQQVCVPQDTWCSTCPRPNSPAETFGRLSSGKPDSLNPASGKQDAPPSDYPVQDESHADGWASENRSNNSQEENFFDAVQVKPMPVTMIAQDSWYEQTKSLLAAIGLMVISVRVLRLIC